MSSATAFTKLRTSKSPAASTGPGSVASAETSVHHIHDATIPEDFEDETAHMIQSPSLPSSHRIAQSRARNSGSLGMFRSVRKRPRHAAESESATTQEHAYDLRDVHRRTKSWNKR